MSFVKGSEIKVTVFVFSLCTAVFPTQTQESKSEV